MCKAINMMLFMLLVGSSMGGEEPASAATKTFQVALSKPWVGYGPMYIALEMGFFDDIDVHIKKVEHASDLLSLLQFGYADAAVMDVVGSLMSALARRAEGAVVLKLSESVGGDGLVVRNSTTHIQQLKGKIVAFPQGGSTHFFLQTLLHDAGMTLNDIEPMYLNSDAANQALITNIADAAVTSEPWLTQTTLKGDANILVTSKEWSDLFTEVLMVNNHYLKENPDVIEAFIRGWFKAVEFWRTHPYEVDDILADHLHIEPEKLEIMRNGIHYSDQADNKAFFAKDFMGQSHFTRLLTKASAQIWLDQLGLKDRPMLHKMDGSQSVLNLVD